MTGSDKDEAEQIIISMENNMKNAIYKTYDELPLFLNAEMVAKLLGVSPSTGYELMHEKGFPVLRIGSRMVVPKEKFREWVEANVEGGAASEI